jgi:hypothetical protein
VPLDRLDRFRRRRDLHQHVSPPSLLLEHLDHIIDVIHVTMSKKDTCYVA